MFLLKKSPFGFKKKPDEPAFKKHDDNDRKNYRPVSILPNLLRSMKGVCTILSTI